MSLSDSLVVKDAANVDKTFVTVSRDGVSTSRIDTSSPDLSNARIMDLKHQSTGNLKAGTAKDRHLLSVSETKSDSTTGKSTSETCNITFTSTRQGQLTNDEIWDLVCIAKNTLTRAVFDAMLLNQS